MEGDGRNGRAVGGVSVPLPRHPLVRRANALPIQHRAGARARRWALLHAGAGLRERGIGRVVRPEWREPRKGVIPCAVRRYERPKAGGPDRRF